MSINSKTKGSKFERNIAKWFTEYSGFKFGRTPYSGAYHSSKDLSSDILCTDEKHAHRCKLSIECKSYKDIKFEHILLGNKSCDILKFWDQATKDAKRSGKVPILCMRYNSMPKIEFFFVVGPELAEAIFTFPEIMKYPYMMINIPKGGFLYIFMASAIKKIIPYKAIHKQAKLSLKHE